MRAETRTSRTKLLNRCVVWWIFETAFKPSASVKIHKIRFIIAAVCIMFMLNSNQSPTCCTARQNLLVLVTVWCLNSYKIAVRVSCVSVWVFRDACPCWRVLKDRRVGSEVRLKFLEWITMWKWETKQQQQQQEVQKKLERTWILNAHILRHEWQTVLLGMRCWCKDLTESGNQSFLLEGQTSQATAKKKEKGCKKPHYKFSKNASCEYIQEKLWKDFLHNFS